MPTIGVRVEPQHVHFAVLTHNDEGPNCEVLDKVSVPKALDYPACLHYVRSTFIDVISQFGVVRAGIRVAEHNEHKPKNRRRIDIEAVLQEAIAASSVVVSYRTFNLNGIAAALANGDTDWVKSERQSSESSLNVRNWPTAQSVALRESVLVALAAKARLQ